MLTNGMAVRSTREPASRSDAVSAWRSTSSGNSPGSPNSARSAPKSMASACRIIPASSPLGCVVHHAGRGGTAGALRTSRPVSRILCPPRREGDDHPSGHTVTGCLERSTRGLGRAALHGASLHHIRAAAPSRVRPSTLLRAGFTEPPRSPGALVRSYRTVSPLPRSRARRSVLCGTDPAGHPGLPLATALLCGVRTFLGPGPARLTASVPPSAAVRPTRSIAESSRDARCR